MLRVNSFANMDEHGMTNNHTKKVDKRLSVEFVKVDSDNNVSSSRSIDKGKEEPKVSNLQTPEESPKSMKKKIKMKPKGPNDIVDILNDITNHGYSKIKLLTTQVNDLMNF